MWTYAAAAVCAVGAMKLYVKATTGWCGIDKDLSDKVVIITGATSGKHCKETARELAKRGATVHLACRNVQAGRAVADEIHQTTGKKVHTWPLDLSSLKSVREFAEKYLSSGQPIHILINNAGIGGYPDKRITADGLEMTMATNHFGPFLLTSLLLERLEASAPSRIVNVASVVHRLPQSFPLDDVNFERTRFYTGYWAYCRSKLANVMFTRELGRRLQGTGVTVCSLHPGTVRTNLFKERNWYSKPWIYIARPFHKSPLEGAQTTLYVSMAPDGDLVSGGYYSDCSPASVNKLAMNDKLIRDFFDLSTKLTSAKW